MEAGREQFEAEVRSLLPEVKLGETSDKLTQDELNLLLAHAHRKVLHLQTQLARLQVLLGWQGKLFCLQEGGKQKAMKIKSASYLPVSLKFQSLPKD